jgi:hypothetical protein
MTNQQHPIIPPAELFNKLKEEWAALGVKIRGDLGNYLVNNAYRIGADQELEACIDWLANARNHTLSWNEATNYSANLRAARRPKPPSLKEQAYAALDTYIYGNPDHGDKQNTYNTIRRALEQLDD